MVWKPGWDLLDPDKLIVAPLAVRYEFEASPKWHAQNPGAMDATGDLLIRRQVAALQSWLLGQRQNARVSNLLIYRTRLTLPGITAEFTKQYGHETLRIIAQPENAGGRIPTTIDVDQDDTILVVADFNGWPIPGYPSSVADVGDFYWYDFASTPGWPGLDGPIDEVAGFFNQGGPWDSKYWARIKAGSKVSTTPLPSKQKLYWEVEIITLANEVPAPYFVASNSTTPDLGAFSDSEIARRDHSGFTRRFPAALNTWLSPCIGVAPEPLLAKRDDGKTFKDTSPGIMGLEKDQDGLTGRSVFVTRGSFKKIVTTVRTVLEAYVDVDYGNGAHSRVDAALDPSANRIWNSGDLVLSGDTVYMFQVTTDNHGFHSSWIGPSSGPPPGLTWSTFVGSNYRALIPWPFGVPDGVASTPGVWWSLVGNVGGGTTDEPAAPYPHTPLGTSFPIFWPVEGQDPIPNTGSMITRFPPVVIDTNDANTTPTYGDGMILINGPPPADGSYAPICVGRADTDGGSVGIALPTLEVGDRIMIAVDTTPEAFFDHFSGKTIASSGKIWFGKNGLWYSPGADWWHSTGSKDFPVGQPAAHLDQTRDAAGNALGPLHYYPACSWRVGPTKLKMRFGRALKYKPPGGFSPYTRGATKFTIPGPDKDDPRIA